MLPPYKKLDETSLLKQNVYDSLNYFVLSGFVVAFYTEIFIFILVNTFVGMFV